MKELIKLYKRLYVKRECFEMHKNIEHKRIGDFLNIRQIGRAFVCFSDNSEKVWDPIETSDDNFAPPKEDRGHPEMWKSGNWRWFISFFHNM